MAKQYHILPSEQEDLHYSDWYQLIAGLMEDTPLGRIVLIRKEKDKKTIEGYGSYEKEVRRRWQRFRLEHPLESAPSAEDISSHFEKLFASLF